MVVLGPTGSGKSDLALLLAERFHGEIVNFDSVQIYRGFDIGSAKLSVDDRRGIPHHLVDFADPAREVTAGSYAREARRVLAGLKRLAVLVGGTGFYLRALLDGLSPAPERDQSLRDRLEVSARKRPGALHRFLRHFDPQAASRIHPNDLQKLIRAIEMIRMAGRPASDTQALPRVGLTGYRVLKIGLDPERKLLYERINGRTAVMFERGLLDETQKLLAAGVTADAKPMQSLGYKQARAVLTGEMSLMAAIEECQTKTRQYAKRQMTWFRRERDVWWLKGFGSEERVQAEVIRRVEEWMRGAV